MNKNVFVQYQLWIDGQYEDTYSDVIEVEGYITSMEDIDKISDVLKAGRFGHVAIVMSFSRFETDGMENRS